jgi:hypothetical protein
MICIPLQSPDGGVQGGVKTTAFLPLYSHSLRAAGERGRRTHVACLNHGQTTPHNTKRTHYNKSHIIFVD